MKTYWTIDRDKYFISIHCIRFDPEKVRRGDDRIDVLFDFGIGWARKPSLDRRRRFFIGIGIPTFRVHELEYKTFFYIG